MNTKAGEKPRRSRDEWFRELALPLAVLAIAAIIVLIALREAAAEAPDPRCNGNAPGAYAVVASRLATAWGERRIAQNDLGDGTVSELWSNPQTGSWTVLLRWPEQGQTCLIGFGVERGRPAS